MVFSQFLLNCLKIFLYLHGLLQNQDAKSHYNVQAQNNYFFYLIDVDYFSSNNSKVCSLMNTFQLLLLVNYYFETSFALFEEIINSLILKNEVLALHTY